MCGIAGILGGTGDRTEIVRAMVSTLAYRGPDDEGVWEDDVAGVALAHRRLSILDLSPAGHQPMLSVGGRYAVVFNGEIYNHLELRAELAEVVWRGHSDTEVLLAAIEAWGIEATLRKLTGMFALGLWDRAGRRLVLARDRMGEKPLYYGWCGGRFIFGSELKALRACPGGCGEIDRDALALFMRYGYVPTPYSIWRGVRKLLPGSYLTIAVDMPDQMPAPVYYWRGLDAATAGTRDDFGGKEGDAQATDELDARLRRAVAGQMVADVPLGVLLSGGVDSSTVAALMQVQSSRPVRSFSLGFAESDYNEALHAKAVAEHLGTDHTEFYVSPSDALKVIPALSRMYDEPFGDSSQIPTYLVAALARQHVTVCLSGDGGDELFGGYNRYFWGRRIWQAVGRYPPGARAGAGFAIRAISPSSWDRFGRVLPPGLRQPTLGDRLHKLAAVVDAADVDDFYRRLVWQQREWQSIVIGAAEPSTWATDEGRRFDAACDAGSRDLAERMMFKDMVGYLVDDILTKVDRAAMATSLETRVPLLDHHLVEFAWSLPFSMKVRDGQGKWLLRQVLQRYVPNELIDRPKQGFGIPLDSWLRGPLRGWAEDLLDESRLVREGFLNPRPIREKWREHLSGRRNWQHWLWNVLMFEAWLEREAAHG